MTLAPDAAFARRVEPGLAVADDAKLIALACRDMADRFRRGGKLVAFGNGAAAADAAHLAVEFVHPVIVGKRALPAISLTNDGPALTGVAHTAGYDATFSAQIGLLARPDDIAVGIAAGAPSRNVAAALAAARELGMLTVALTAVGEEEALGGVDHLLVARTNDARIAKEIHVTTFHILWEIVHVFLDQPGLSAVKR